MSKKITQKIINLPLEEILEYSKNMNLSTNVEELKNIIKKYGYQDRIVIDDNKYILIGHSRYKALKSLGEKEIEVIQIYGLSKLQKKKYRIEDNLIKKENEIAEDSFLAELRESNDLELQDFFNIDLGDILKEGTEQNTSFKPISGDEIKKTQSQMTTKFEDMQNGTIITKNFNCPNCKCNFSSNINNNNF